MGRSTLPARTRAPVDPLPTSSTITSNLQGRERTSYTFGHPYSMCWLVRLYTGFLAFVHISSGSKESGHWTQMVASSSRVSMETSGIEHLEIINNDSDTSACLTKTKINDSNTRSSGAYNIGSGPLPPSYAKVVQGKNVADTKYSKEQTAGQVVVHQSVLEHGAYKQATSQQTNDPESGIPSRSARGLSLPVFLTVMGGVITFSIAVLSLNFSIDESVIHTTLRILGRVFSAIGLVYALAVSLFFALAASTSEENEYRVKRKRCVQVLLPSVMCSLVGLAYVLAEAWEA